MKQISTFVLVVLCLGSVAFAEAPTACEDRFRQIESIYAAEKQAAQLKYEKLLAKTNKWFQNAKRNAPDVKTMYRMRAKHDDAIAALNKAVSVERDRIERKHEDALSRWETECNQPKAQPEKVRVDVVIENKKSSAQQENSISPVVRRPKKKKKASKSTKAGKNTATRSKASPTRTSKKRTKRSYDAQSAALINEAEKHLKTRYRYGGNSPKQGFDCSGYMKYVYKKQGIELPRVSRDQAKTGSKVKRNQVRPGDLVYFGKSKAKITHIGMVVSEPGEPLRMIHASSSKGVEITDVEGIKYWEKRLQGFRRVIK